MPANIPLQNMDVQSPTDPQDEHIYDEIYDRVIPLSGIQESAVSGIRPTRDIPESWLNRLLPSTEPVGGIDWQTVYGRIFVLNDDGVFRSLVTEELVKADKERELKREPARKLPYNLGDILQQFTSLPLARIHHYANTGEYLQLLFTHRKLIDVLIHVNGQLFAAHRIALACHSVYFARAFILNQHQKHSLTEVRLRNTDAHCFYAILRFIYTGKLIVNEKNVQDLIEVARQLQIPAVLYKCLDYLERMPVKKSDVNPEREGVNYEKKTGKEAAEKLKNEAERDQANLYKETGRQSPLKSQKDGEDEREPKEMDPLMAKREASRWQQIKLAELKHNEDFLSEPVEVMEVILQDDNVQIDSELDVFYAAMAWIAYKLGARRRYAVRIMRHIRFTCMTPAEIIEATQVNNFIRNTSFCRNRVLEAIWLMTLKGYQTYDVFDCPCPKTRRCLEGRGPYPPIEAITSHTDHLNNSNSVPPYEPGCGDAEDHENSRQPGGLQDYVFLSARHEEIAQVSNRDHCQLHRGHDPESCDMLGHVSHDASVATFSNPNNMSAVSSKQHHNVLSLTSPGMNILYPANADARANFCQSAIGNPSSGGGKISDQDEFAGQSRWSLSAGGSLQHHPDASPVDRARCGSRFSPRRHLPPTADLTRTASGISEQSVAPSYSGQSSNAMEVSRINGPALMNAVRSGRVLLGSRPQRSSGAISPKPTPGRPGPSYGLSGPSGVFRTIEAPRRSNMGINIARRGSANVPDIGKPGSNLSKSVIPVSTKRKGSIQFSNHSFNSATSLESKRLLGNIETERVGMQQPLKSVTQQSIPMSVMDDKPPEVIPEGSSQTFLPTMSTKLGPQMKSKKGSNMWRHVNDSSVYGSSPMQVPTSSGMASVYKTGNFTTYGTPPTRTPSSTPLILLSSKTPPPPPPPPEQPPPPPPARKEFAEVPVIKLYSSRFQGRYQGETTGLEVTFKLREVSPTGVEQAESKSAPGGNVEITDGDLLVVGGFIDSSSRVESSQAHRLDSSQQKWERFSQVPETRLHFGAALLNNKICLCGGYDPGHSKIKARTDTFLFDFEKRKWDRGGHMLYARAFHAVCVLGGRLFAMGGQDQDERTQKTLEVYDPETDRWSLRCSMNSCRAAACAATIQGRVMSVGGYGESDEPDYPCPLLYSTEWFEPDINRWQTRGRLRIPRAQACLVAVDSYLYLCGGVARHPSTGVIYSIPDVDRYNSDTDQWTRITQLQSARHNAGASIIDGKIYVVGGMSTDIDKALRSVECYDTATEMWDTTLPELPLGAKSVACIVFSP